MKQLNKNELADNAAESKWTNIDVNGKYLRLTGSENIGVSNVRIDLIEELSIQGGTSPAAKDSFIFVITSSYIHKVEYPYNFITNKYYDLLAHCQNF